MPHIIETKDEDVDWEKFYTVGIPKGIPDVQWRKLIGNRAWKMIHGTIDNYPCETCREPGHKLVNGLHDVVGVSLGKKIFDPESLAFLIEAVHFVERTRGTELAELLEKKPSVRHEKHPEVVVTA